MYRVQRLMAAFLLLIAQTESVSAFAASSSTLYKSGKILRVRGGAGLVGGNGRIKRGAGSSAEENSEALQDFRGQASALFGNIRIPAALFAGASAGAAFAMPLSMQSESLKFGLVKRLYALLMMGALSSEIIAVVVSTVTVASLSARESPKTKSVSDLLEQSYAFEWITARLHFLMGVMYFVLGMGFRAWITIACPIIAKAALGTILSAALLCVAVVMEVETTQAFVGNFFTMPWKFTKLFAARAKRKPLFALALALSATTGGYILYQTPHVLTYLADKAS